MKMLCCAYHQRPISNDWLYTYTFVEGVLVDAKLDMTRPVCARSPESQPYPGLHHKQHGQQVEGGDSALLLCSGETPLGVLHPDLEPPAQERHGAVGAAPEEGHKMI